MAEKKISELPIVVDNIYKISDSDVVAMVSASTTAQITIKTLRDKITEFAAKTGSANTFTGNQIVNGSVTITGKLTVNDIETIYQTSSVVFSSGSNKFGDQSSDKHEFTGSVAMTGSLIVNGDSVNIGTLNSFTSSQLGVNVGNSIVTASFNAFTSSQLGVNVGISIVSASFNSFSSSQLEVNVGNSIVTSSLNNFTSSQLGVNVGVSIVTSSFNSFTSSQLGVNVGISIVTASFNEHSRSINERVADIQFYTSSVKVEIGQILAYTASVNTFTASGKIDVANIQAYTASVKEEISQILAYTASVKNEVANIQAYTSSVKTEIGQIVAYTSSLNSYTQSAKIDVANIQAYTASVKETISQTLAYTSSVKTEIGQIVAYTSSLNSYTQSAKIDVANIQSYTASVKETITQTLAYTASVKNEIGQIVAYTSSLNSYTQSAKIDIANIQAYTASVKNEVANIQAYTASVKNEIGQIVSYTASLNVFTASAKLDIAGLQSYSHSLKSVALVSGSQQVIDYNKFALTASANTFYGTQTIQGNLQLSSTSPLVYNAGDTNAMLFGFFDGSSIYGPYYQIFGSNYSNTTQRGSAEFVFDSRNSGFTGFNIAEFNGSTWLRKFRVSPSGAEVTGSFVVDGGITGSLMATNNVVSSSTQIQNYNLFAVTSSANTFYGTQTFASTAGNGLRVYGAAGTHQWDVYLNGENLRISDNTAGDGALVVDKRASFGGHITGSGNLSVVRASIGSTATPTIPLEVYGQQKWYTTTGDGSELRGFFNPGGAADDSELTLYKADGTTAGIKLTPNGIDFSNFTGGAGKSSQLLDDYEEGTLTGTITCGTSGTVTLDNGYNTLSYTKIGSVVHVFGLLSVSSVSSPVGYFTIPLPFACANLGDSAATSAATIIVNGTNAANTSDFVGWADETQSNIVVRRGDATGVQNTSANELKALTDIYIQFTYRAN